MTQINSAIIHQQARAIELEALSKDDLIKTVVGLENEKNEMVNAQREAILSVKRTVGAQINQLRIKQSELTERVTITAGGVDYIIKEIYTHPESGKAVVLHGLCGPGILSFQYCYPTAEGEEPEFDFATKLLPIIPGAGKEY